VPINRIRLDDVDIRNITTTTTIITESIKELDQRLDKNYSELNSTIASADSANYSQLVSLINSGDALKANIASPTFTGTVTAGSTLITNEIIENSQLIASAPTSTQIVDIESSSIFYHTVANTANWTFNFRWNSTVSLNTQLTIGQTVTPTIITSNGATPFRPTAFQIDGMSVTPRWADALAPSTGNANNIDIYSFSIIKTAASTFLVLASLARFN
jgi:hypothetical protein